MPQSKKLPRLAAAAAIALCVAAMLRTAFTGLEIDEEYALSIGFRLVSGDKLFYTMWEPHQLSALLAALVLALFTAVTGGTTGALLFFRLLVLCCKAGMSYVFYREFRRTLGGPVTLAAALVLLCYSPKWFLGPDYTGQQFYFTVAAFLCLYHYVTHGFRQGWLVVLAALCACLSFLAFPQSIAAFVFLWLGMVLLGRRGGEKTYLAIPRGAWLLLGSCAVCGIAFLVYALWGLGFSVPLLLARLQLILHDPQYSFTAGERLSQMLAQALPVARGLLWSLLAAVVLTAGAVLCGKSCRHVPGLFLCLWGGCAAVQSLARSVAQSSLDERQFVPVLVLAGAYAFYKRRTPQTAALLWLGYLPGLAAYAMILRSSLVGLSTTFMYLTWPAVCGLLAMAAPGGEEENPEVQGRRTMLCLVPMLAMLVVCRFWCVQTIGWRPHNITDTPLKQITTGPAKGIWADEKAADMQECLYRALQDYSGQALLQAIGEQHGLGFLMADGSLTVAQASVISGTDSDPRFEQYYAELPQKTPDIILYDENEVRDMAAFHTWIEDNFTILDRYAVEYGTAHLQLLTVQR